MKILIAAAATVLLALAAASTPASAARLTFMLNWTPTADHSPIYFARAQGWYRDEGIDLQIEVGRGSGATALAVGLGRAQMGIADLPTAMVARGRGADLTAVMAIYANSPQGFYWLRSSGINGPRDFAGRSIGNPPGDASRVMWPAFARHAGLEPGSVRFVNVSPAAKVASLKARSVDIISDFYNEHDLKVRTFGDDLGFASWRSVGLHMYGNSVIANRAFLEANRDVVARFVRITQRAYEACVRSFEPCLQALMASVSGLDADNQRAQWGRIKTLMRDDTTTRVALGAFDGGRIRADHELVRSLIGFDTAFDPATMFTNDFLDMRIRMSVQ